MVMHKLSLPPINGESYCNICQNNRNTISLPHGSALLWLRQKEHRATHPQEGLDGLWVKQAHDAVVPGETGSHHEDAHSTDEGRNVTHVGEAIPKKATNMAQEVERGA